MTEKNTAAIVLAAGNGTRMGSGVKKQYLEIGGKPLIYYALQAFEESVIEEVILVTVPGEENYCQTEIVEKYSFHKISKIIAGGKERYDSVYCGLCQLVNCNYVLIHDGARPFVTPEIIKRALQGAMKYQACVVGMPSKDTVKISTEDHYAQHTPNRNQVWMIQTPQAFSFSLIQEAYNKLQTKTKVAVTDDAMVVETVLDKKIKLMEGSYYNIKITTPEDLRIAEVFLEDYRKAEIP